MTAQEIEELVRRVVREELAKQQNGSYWLPNPSWSGRCAFCGADHGTMMCPQLRPGSFIDLTNGNLS